MPAKKTAPCVDRNSAEEAMGALAYATHQRDKIAAKMNLKLTAVRDQFEPEIAGLSVVIDAETARLRAFADQHPDLFARVKSFKLTHGTIGYRLGNFALKTVKGITWVRAINLIKDRLPGYIRTKEEVDKEALLADRAKLTPNDFQRVGLRVEQAEAFYAECEKDTVQE